MFNANGEWVPENDSVADGVAKITSQDSSLMRQASAMGMRQANRRGLANSSISAGAARSAQLGYATPIASQDASQLGAKNLARITGDYDMSRTRLTLDAQERDAAAGRISDAFRNYSDSNSSLNNNSEIPASARAAQQQSYLNALNSQLAAFKKLYPQVNLDWGVGP